MTEARAQRASRRPARHEHPAIDEAGLVAARHADRLLAAAREIGLRRAGSRTSSRCPDRLRDDDPTALRATATRCRAAYGVKDSIRDVLPESLTEPFLDFDRPADPRAQPGAGLSPSSSGLNASSRNGEGTAGSYTSVSERRARVHAT